MGTMTQQVTRSEADLILRHTVADAYAEEGYDWLEADTVAWKLAYYLNAPVDSDYVVDMIAAHRDLEQIADGTDDRIKVNATYTVDNRAELVEYTEGQLNIAVNGLLDSAGIRGQHINRYSQVI